MGSQGHLGVPRGTRLLHSLARMGAGLGVINQRELWDMNGPDERVKKVRSDCTRPLVNKRGHALCSLTAATLGGGGGCDTQEFPFSTGTCFYVNMLPNNKSDASVRVWDGKETGKMGTACCEPVQFFQLFIRLCHSFRLLKQGVSDRGPVVFLVFWQK